jgi:hypothetical protein
LGLTIASLTIGAALLPARTHAQVTPTAITFTINHADCAGLGAHRFDSS